VSPASRRAIAQFCDDTSAAAAASRYITLRAGDVIWMGTDEPTLDMVAADTVEVEISGIGVLCNPVVRE
jgi:2-keto-4-pentenoate hydratase/2-oxohepta-3-ene-1,7-dioic acid hydratase in catechol pathway